MKNNIKRFINTIISNKIFLISFVFIINFICFYNIIIYIKNYIINVHYFNR